MESPVKDFRMDIPAPLAARVLAADAILLITITDDGKLETAGVPRNAPFVPHLDAAHAYLQAVKDAHPDLLAKVLGEITDADRYRAVRAFATLASRDKEQFEKVNEMLKDFEETIPEPNQRSSADTDKLADFLVHALIETTPGFNAPTTAPEVPQNATGS